LAPGELEEPCGALVGRAHVRVPPKLTLPLEVSFGHRQQLGKRGTRRGSVSVCVTLPIDHVARLS